eukprot:45855_1
MQTAAKFKLLPLCENNLERFIVFQGLSYCMLTIFCNLAFPRFWQIIPPFETYDDKDLLACRVGGIVILSVGVTYVLAGCGAFMRREVVSRITSTPYDESETHVNLFAFVTIIERTLHIVPVCIIAYFTVAHVSPLTKKLLVVFLIVDPVLAIATWIAAKKFIKQ